MIEVITLSSSPPTTPIRLSRAVFPGPSKNSFLQDGDEFSDFNSDVEFTFGRSKKTVSKATIEASNVETRIHSDSVPVPVHSLPSTSQVNELVGLSGRIEHNAILSDSIFDDTDFLIEQPAKKRRLSPNLLTNPDSKSAVEAEDVFDLSSEPDRVSQLTYHPANNDNKADSHSVDDDEAHPKSAAPVLELPELVGSTVTLDDRNEVFEVLSDDVVVTTDTMMNSLRSTPKSRSLKYSAKTAALLEKVNMTSGIAVGRTQASHKRCGSVTSYAKATKSNRAALAMENVDNILDSSPARADHASKKPEKHAENDHKATEKDAGKERKKREKEQKAAEKQRTADIAEVNKKKTNKKDSTQEMIIDLPMALRNKSLGNKVEAEIQTLNAELSYYVDEIDMTASSSSSKNLGNVIRWRRKVASTYNENTEEWVPLTRTKIVTEKHILVHLTAEDFCSIAAAGPNGQQDEMLNTEAPSEDIMQGHLDMYVALLRSRYPGCTIVMLIEGLTLWLKKHINAKNREYIAAVRAQPNSLVPTYINDQPASQPLASSSRASKKRKDTSSMNLSFIDSDIAESLLLHLQICHQPLRIHQTIQSESWEQIVAFTQHLSTRPYRSVELERNIAHASFCMTSGQFKTGQGDPLDTWVKMLEQVNRLTVSMAQGIVKEGYESPAQLVQAFRKIEGSTSNGAQDLSRGARANREAKELAKIMLQDVNRARSDQRLGSAVSKRLYKIFMSSDEDLRDGIA